MANSFILAKNDQIFGQKEGLKCFFLGKMYQKGFEAMSFSTGQKLPKTIFLELNAKY